MISLRVLKKTLLSAVCAAAFVYSAHAQVTPVNTTVIVANPAANDDFLLPSYLDSEVAVRNTPVAPQQKEIETPTDVDILTAIFGAPPTAPTNQPTADQSENENNLAEQANADTATTDDGREAERRVFYPNRQKQEEEKQKKLAEETPVLTLLPPVPDAPESPIPPKKRTVPKSEYVKKAVGKTIQGVNTDFELPKEMRILFYPNRTDLSAQNVMWVKSFAAYVMKDPRLLLTLRISNQNWPLQRARLTLLIQAALETGLSARQIRAYSSDRDADSIVLGYVHNDNLTRIQPERDKITPIKTQKTLSW